MKRKSSSASVMELSICSIYIYAYSFNVPFIQKASFPIKLEREKKKNQKRKAEMGWGNHISFWMVCLALIGIVAGQESAAADKLSPFCEGLPREKVPFCSQVLQGETVWEKAVVKMIMATMEIVKSSQPKAEAIGESLPATIPEPDRADVAEKCKSGYNYALENLNHSLKRIRRGVYVRTDNVVYTAWAGIYECSGALKHFNVIIHNHLINIMQQYI